MIYVSLYNREITAGKIKELRSAKEAFLTETFQQLLENIDDNSLKDVS